MGKSWGKYSVPDYSKSLTKDSQERSRIYQVVEAERRTKPDAKKNTLSK